MATTDDTPALSWVCPACGRRVPRTFGQCRCGQVQSAPAVDARSQDVKSPGPSRSGQWSGWIAAVILASVSGVLWLNVHPAPTQRAPAAKAAYRPEPVTRSTTPIQLTNVVVAPSAAPQLPQPLTKSDQAASPPAESPPLEEVVGRATPAVVLIETPAGRGSGFFVKPDTIITNAHVAGTETSVTVTRFNGEQVSARVVLVAQEFDLAVLKTSPPLENQPSLQLGSVSHIRAGQEVVAIGSPLGVLQNSVTRGIVSSIRRLGGVTLIQTDAAINPGNSGGPLLDHHGDVIGITTMSVKATQGLSFAVSAEHARQLIDGQRSIPTTNATPLSSLNTTLQSSAGSGSDEIRQKGASAYEQALAQLAGRADGLDEYWRRFKASCYEGRIAGEFEREWFAIWDPKAMQGAVALGCGASFAEVKRDAEQIRTAIVAAEEAARQAGVYPGPRRDARRKYRLDGIDR
jgi:S1-C subfamily serine protease